MDPTFRKEKSLIKNKVHFGLKSDSKCDNNGLQVESMVFKAIFYKPLGCLFMLWTVLSLCTFIMLNKLYHREAKTRQFKSTDDNNMSIFMWFELTVSNYVGSKGQQSYSYATPKDIIIGYNYQNIDKDWFLWLLELNNLSPTQFVWIEEEEFGDGPRPIDLINNTNFIKQISLIIADQIKNNHIDTVILRPFWQRHGVSLLIDKIKSFVPNRYTDSIVTAIADKSWMNKFGTKACLHRHIDNLNKKSLVESVNMFVNSNGLTETKGYLCNNKNEILAAFDKLTHEIGHRNVVLKDCDGASGYDISFYNNKIDIINKFIWKNKFKLVSVEEDLRYYVNVSQKNKIHKEFAVENVEFVGISFYENQIIGGGHQQIINGDSEFIGSKTYSNKLMEERLKTITKYDVMNKIGTKYVGGFDFAIQRFKNRNILPKIYLIDFNTGRSTATAQTFIVMERFNIKHKFFIRINVKIETNATFEILIKYYSQLLFHKKSKKGIYFHAFYPKGQVAVLSIFGDNETEANSLYQTLKSVPFVLS